MTLRRASVARGGGIGVALVAALLFPMAFSNPSTLNIALLTLMYVALASSWNLLGGFAGYISLGVSAFFGIGAYSLGFILEHVIKASAGYAPFALVPVAGLIAAVVAIPVGWVALRTRHAVFATVTIAIMFVFQLLATNLTGLTGGSAGLGFPVPTWSGDFFDKPFYYAMLVIAVVAVAVCWAVRRSSLGLGLLAIRDDEDKAEAIGVPTTKYKMIAFVVSAGLAGMAGGVYGYYVTYIYPQFTVDPLISIGAALMAFLGGSGTLIGPVLGAVVLEPSQLELSYNVNGQVYLILYGGIFLAVILLLPKGVVPSVRDWIVTRRARQGAVSIAPPASAGVVSTQ
ncbi:MAG TPA: branched-chain amino acid ABC transporter permease [Solirubrobacteraceae bacterium]|jgi:branched-chain amino acid transport system permease protein|nr:branched-chain amino acid ABC transporter permease [Solirubrobacteraceae bacterium]